VQDFTPIELLVDADAWQIWGQNVTYIIFLYFLPPSCSKNVPALLSAVMRFIFLFFVIFAVACIDETQINK